MRVDVRLSDKNLSPVEFLPMKVRKHWDLTKKIRIYCVHFMLYKGFGVMIAVMPLLIKINCKGNTFL